MKYVVVSLHRCGTLSTANYLNWLGIPAVHWPTEHEGVNLEDKIVGRETDHAHVIDVLSPILQGFEAVADVPFPVLYRELFASHPHARFILLYRNAFDWVRSNRAFHQRRGTNLRPYERVMYWHYFSWHPHSLDELTDSQLMWMHAQHTADVIGFFNGQAPTHLGVFDLNDRDVGPKLAKFLGVQSELVFPQYNAGPDLEYIAR
jgi:Sulfotransferase domain